MNVVKPDLYECDKEKNGKGRHNLQAGNSTIFSVKNIKLMNQRR